MIIFLYGEDAFRSYQKVNEIKEKYLQSDKSGSGLSLFDVEDEKGVAEKIIGAISTANLLAPKRLVIVRNAVAGNDKEDKYLEEYLKKHLEGILRMDDLVLVFWERGMPLKSNSFFKFLDKNIKSQNFEKLGGAKLEQWVLKEVKRGNENSEISNAAIEKLIVYTGGNLISLSREIQKLLDFADGKMISEQDVDLLVKANLEGDIFRTVDAIGNRDRKTALSLVHRHLENGEDPFYLLSMFVYQFRNLLKISSLKEEGVYNEFEIARIAKLHPFVVKKGLGQIGRMSGQKLRGIYGELGKIDFEVKTGKIDIKLALDKFIAEI